MDSTNTFQAQLRSIEYLCGLAYLTDMTNHLNVLNLILQGKEQSISHLVGHVEGFRSKLVLFTNYLQNNNLAHFPSCSVIYTFDIFQFVILFSCLIIKKTQINVMYKNQCKLTETFKKITVNLLQINAFSLKLILGFSVRNFR